MNKFNLRGPLAGIISALGAIFLQPVAIAAAPVAPTLTWAVTPMVASQYMFRGSRLGGPSFQPTIEAGYGAWTIGAWASVPLDDTMPGVSDPEFNLLGSYTVNLADRLSLVGGATWYIFPRAERSAGYYRQTFEPNIALNYTVSGVRFTPKLYYDFALEGPTAELTAAYALPLQSLGTELNFSATAGTFKWRNALERATPNVSNWGSYWSAGVALPFQVTLNGRVIAGFAYHRGFDNELKQGTAPKSAKAAAMGRGVVTLAYMLTF